MYRNKSTCYCPMHPCILHCWNNGNVHEFSYSIYSFNTVCGCCCLGAVPIIRCPRGNAAEMVAVVSSRRWFMHDVRWKLYEWIKRTWLSSHRSSSSKCVRYKMTLRGDSRSHCSDVNLSSVIVQHLNFFLQVCRWLRRTFKFFNKNWISHHLLSQYLLVQPTTDLNNNKKTVTIKLAKGVHWGLNYNHQIWEKWFS